MKYVFYNIRNLARNEKFIFALMLLCIFTSAWIMTFSYGLYQHYFSMRTEADEESKQLYPEIAEGEILTRGEAEAYLNSLSDDGTILLYGQKYKIVGTHTSNGSVVPFLSIPEDIPLDRLSFNFERPMTRKNYNELVERAAEIIPGKLIFPEFAGPDVESIYIYGNIMMISVLIAALVIVNFAFLYRFIFGKRRRQLAILRICGCTAARARAICLGECIVICAPVFLAGMLTFIPFMHNVLSDVFEYMEESYEPWIYAAVFGIYLGSLIIVMGIFLASRIGKTIAESRKETAV